MRTKKKDMAKQIPIWAYFRETSKGNGRWTFLISFTRSIDAPGLMRTDRSRDLLPLSIAAGTPHPVDRPDIAVIQISSAFRHYDRHSYDSVLFALRRYYTRENFNRTISVTLKGRMEQWHAERP